MTVVIQFRRKEHLRRQRSEDYDLFTVSSFVFTFYFRFTYVVCMSVFPHVYYVPYAHGGQKRASDPLSWSYGQL